MRHIDDFSVTVDSIRDGKAGKTLFSTRELLLHMVRSGRQFSSDYSGIRLGSRVEEACKRTAKGPIALDSADWEVVAEACKSPTPQPGHPAYPLSPAHRCIPLVEKVLAAKEHAEPKGKRR